MPQTDHRVLALTAQIVSAQIERNELPAAALQGLIRDVYRALADVRPAVAPDTSVQNVSLLRATVSGQGVSGDSLVCLECGLRMKMLKRHLQSVHGMTPPQYRSKFRLSADHPMVAPRYAALRSSLAKASGLGKRPVPKRP